MAMLLTIVIVVLVALVAVGMPVLLILDLLQERRRFRRFAQAPCAGRTWCQSFPTAPKDDIRNFLDLVYAEFGPNCLSRRLNRRLRLTLVPSERVLDLYHLMYPKGSRFDHMELESFANDFEEEYGIDLEVHWREDITLGEIFALTRQG